jgi:hypothetical protein
MTAKYTAILIHEHHVLFERKHADFFEAQAAVLSRLQDKYSHAQGLIIDNNSGKTLNRYRKVTCYD